MEKSEILSPEDELFREVVGLLRELLHAFLLASVPAWVDLPLTLPQLRIVFIVAHNKKSSVMQIAKHLEIGEPTASHLIDKLVQAGLVDRSEDPLDRRRAVICLTPAGEALIEKLLGWEEFLGVWLHKVSDEDLSLFRRGLTAVITEAHGQASNERRFFDGDGH